MKKTIYVVIKEYSSCKREILAAYTKQEDAIEEVKKWNDQSGFLYYQQSVELDPTKEN